jgi:anti-sigma regulatory factor (Ser/Thr protein kinase)
MGEHTNRLQLPPEPSSAGMARRFVASSLVASVEVAELAVLLVSELASNAVLHARTPFELVVDDDGQRLRVEVHDDSPDLPTLRDYVAESVTGRGLHMVAASADNWGFEACDRGKCVWFELAQDASSSNS